MKRKKFCVFTAVGRDNHEVVIFRQTKCMKDYGYDVSYVVCDNIPNEVVDETNVISTKFTSGGYFKRTFINPWKMYRFLRHLDADVYQTACVEFLFICILLKIQGKKVVYNLREAHPYTLYSKSNMPKWIKHTVVTFLAVYMKICLKKVDAVIAVSDGIMEYLKKWGIEKSYLVGNFPFVNPKHDFTFEEYLQRQPCIIYFGSIYGISCQTEFLDALADIPNVKYLLAGIFYSELYQEKVQSHKAWNKVEFINGFEYSELSAMLERSTASNVLRDFTSVSNDKNGSLGIIKIFESMEAGLPIICSDVPVYREMMSKYKCGILVNPKNVDQIADAIKYLTEHKREAYEMGQEGRRAVINEYSWDAQSKVYYKIIDGLFL